MNSIIEAAVTHVRTVLMILVLLLLSGLSTYFSIPKESDPDVNIPYIYVSIIHDGISPEDAERLLVRPMENQLRSIDGVKEMKAYAGEGNAWVQLEFEAGTSSKEALADVRDKVTLAKAKLPSETEEPTVHEVTMAEENPAVTVVLSGAIPERALVQAARDLKDELETLPEVLEADIGGAREDMVEILVDPLLMESYGLNQQDIGNLVARNNRLVAAGTLDTGKGRFAVKVPSVFETVGDIMEMPIKADGDRVITFQDIATIRRSYKDPDSFARLNGKSSISVEVKKRPGENIIQTVADTRHIVAELQQQWPDNLVVTYTGDQSEDVEDMLSSLQNNVLSAILLVVVVIVGVLGLRTAGIVGIAIPGSFLTGILALAIMGFTINIIVLFGLIMAVGMLVDGGIVVTEYADRCMNEGMPRQQAYSEAAKRMAWPIIASTATTLAAFAPLIFWPGIVGEFMKYLPITLIVTLLASLFMALIFVPSLGTVFGKPQPMDQAARDRLIQAEQGDIRHLPGVGGRYVKVLEWAIKRPWWILCSAFLFTVLVIFGYIRSNLGMEFFPNVEPSGADLYVRSYGDLSIMEKDQIMRNIEHRILDMKEIKTLYSRTGGTDRVGVMRINLVDWQKRRPADEIIKDIRQRLDNFAGVEIEIRKDKNGPSSGKDLRLELSSRYPELVDPAVRVIRQALEMSGQFTNIEDDGPKPGIEWQLKVNRADAARFGADSTLVGNSVQMVTNGLKLGEYRTDDVDDELDIRVRFPEDKRNINELDELRVPTSYGLVPISNFVKRSPHQKTDAIRKVDAKRVITVGADLKPGKVLNLALPELTKAIQALDLDPRVHWQVKGQNEEEQESQQFLVNAFLVALFVMAIILVTQFNSFYQAFLILSAVLFSTAGVFLGLWLTHRPFGLVMSGIGVISLAGIVVNNNIVLIDTFNVLRREGMNVTDAILRTGAQRLRPVMLTTITTVLGLLPMVTEVNIDLFNRSIEVGGPSTQWWSQLATAVAGGLTFATLLTLVLTPCMLMIGQRVGIRWSRLRHRSKSTGEVLAE